MAVQADFREIAKLVKGLEKAQATVVRKAIRNAVTTVGADATKRVKAEAGTFSREIADATGMKVSFAARGAGVKITTDQKQVPYARLYERGGKGTNGKYWKHPVFGAKNGGKSGWAMIRAQTKARYEAKEEWQKQETHKFFYNSVWAERDELKKKLAEEVGKILADIKEG